MNDAILITIDGKPVPAHSGDTVFTAAKRAGLAIPGLCSSEHLAPFGSCRLCVCEVEGQKGTPASCTTPVQAGMVVHTHTDRLVQLRRNVTEQPDGGVLPAALQELARSVGLDRVRYRQPAVRERIQDSSNPFFTFDNARCVSCARCVRACDEIQGTFALTMAGRGFGSRPMAGTSCYGDPATGFAASNYDLRLLRGGMHVRRRPSGWAGGDDGACR
jgi:formate dehydrogenase major subunit